MSKRKVVAACALSIICTILLTAWLLAEEGASLDQGEQTDPQLPKYYVNTFDHYFICFDEQGHLLWRMRKSRVGQYGWPVWWDGYLVVVDSSNYKLVAIPSGDVLYERPLKICPSGFTLSEDTIELRGRRKTRTFPVFPKGFRSKYREHWIPRERCSRLLPLAARGAGPRGAETENQVIDFGPFVAAFDGLGRERWRKALDRPCQLDAAYGQVLIAKDRKIVSVDEDDGTLAWQVELPDTVLELVTGKLIYAVLDNGDTVSLWQQVSDWGTRKRDERERQQRETAVQPSER